MASLLSLLSGSGLLGLILGALGKMLTDWLASKQRDQALVDLGAAHEASAANKESADAEARMAEANAAPRSRQSALDRLRDGSA